MVIRQKEEKEKNVETFRNWTSFQFHFQSFLFLWKCRKKKKPLGSFSFEKNLVMFQTRAFERNICPVLCYVKSCCRFRKKASIHLIGNLRKRLFRGGDDWVMSQLWIMNGINLKINNWLYRKCERCVHVGFSTEFRKKMSYYFLWRNEKLSW